MVAWTIWTHRTIWMLPRVWARLSQLQSGHDRICERGGACEALVGGDQRGVELVGEFDVDRIEEPKVQAARPGSEQQRREELTLDRHRCQQVKSRLNMGIEEVAAASQ